MGITYRIDAPAVITYVLFDGPVSDDDYISHTHRLMADPAWLPTVKLHLTDVTSQQDPDLLSVETIRDMAELWRDRAEKVHGLKVGIVATLGFGNAEVFEQSASQYGLSVIVFNSLPTACLWLGTDEEKARQVFRDLRVQARNN